MKFIFKYLRPFYLRMFFGLIIKFTGTIMDLFLPMILAHIIDEVVPQKDLRAVILWGILMIVCAVLALAGNIIANRMATKVARDATQVIRHDLFVKIMHLSTKNVDRFSVSSLESRLTSDTLHIQRVIGFMQRLGIRSPILLIGGVVMTFALDPVLALVLLGIIPLAFAVVFFVSRKGLKLYTKLQESYDGVVRVLRENIQGIRIIKALSKTQHEYERFEGVNNDLMSYEQRSGKTMAITGPAMQIFLNLGLCIVLLLGAARVNAGLSQAGKIMAFMNYFTIILNAVTTINRVFTMFSKAIASANRVAEVIDCQNQDRFLPPVSAQPDAPHIAFNDVSFSYNGKVNTLTHISFALQRGQTLGVIGATGSGKTTLAKLLIKFYDPTEGTVCIDGRDICSIPTEELHRKFGIVLQKDFLFADTVTENISFGRSLTEEQVDCALHTARAADFVAEKGGKSHVLSIKGANLSGGQKQRLYIARAIAAEPEILILDDASSALDYKTDAALRAGLAEMQQTTKIIIAQRISSIMTADHILVLDHGHIIGSGTHEDLLISCSVYKEISDSQIGGEVID